MALLGMHGSRSALKSTDLNNGPDTKEESSSFVCTHMSLRGVEVVVALCVLSIAIGEAGRS